MWSRKIGSGSALLSLMGAFLWAGISTAAGARRAPFGLIELLLLFAVLVAVPLGLELARIVSPPHPNRLGRTARVLQPFAAAAIVVSLWQPPGSVAAALTVPWLLLELLVALAGIIPLFPKRNRSLDGIAVGIAGLDLALAGGWLLLARSGLRPVGFQEPIMLLTAVHFHYIGFATAVIAAAAVQVFDGRGRPFSMLRPLVWLVLFLPFVLAAGFVLSPVLRVAAAVALAATMTALAGLLFWLGRYPLVPAARIYLRLAGGAAGIAMGLAGTYAVSDYIGKPVLTMSGMASTHGVLNGLGFVLLSTLAFLLELHGNELEQRETSRAQGRGRAASEVPRKRPTPVPHPTPEFVARDFYDR